MVTRGGTAPRRPACQPTTGNLFMFCHCQVPVRRRPREELQTTLHCKLLPLASESGGALSAYSMRTCTPSRYASCSTAFSPFRVLATSTAQHFKSNEKMVKKQTPWRWSTSLQPTFEESVNKTNHTLKNLLCSELSPIHAISVDRVNYSNWCLDTQLQIVFFILLVDCFIFFK